MDRGDQAEVRLRVAAVVEQRRKIRQADLARPGLLLRRLYLFRFSLLASPFVFTHASSVPRVAEITRRFQVGLENQRHNRCRIGSAPGSGGQ